MLLMFLVDKTEQYRFAYLNAYQPFIAEKLKQITIVHKVYTRKAYIFQKTFKTSSIKLCLNVLFLWQFLYSLNKLFLGL
jgi:beta-N-acetylglucosaminidase